MKFTNLCGTSGPFKIGFKIITRPFGKKCWRVWMFIIFVNHKFDINRCFTEFLRLQVWVFRCKLQMQSSVQICPTWNALSNDDSRRASLKFSIFFFFFVVRSRKTGDLILAFHRMYKILYHTRLHTACFRPRAR